MEGLGRTECRETQRAMRGPERWRDREEGEEEGEEEGGEDGEKQVEEGGGGGWGVPGAPRAGPQQEVLAMDPWFPVRSSRRLRVPSWACLPAAGCHHRRRRHHHHHHFSFSPPRPPPACPPAACAGSWSAGGRGGER